MLEGKISHTNNATTVAFSKKGISGNKHDFLKTFALLVAGNNCMFYFNITQHTYVCATTTTATPPAMLTASVDAWACLPRGIKNHTSENDGG